MLTLTGDTGANSVAVTYESGRLTVRGASGTAVNSKTTDYVVTVPGQISITANMSAGNDTLTITGASLSTASISLGNGNDSLRLSYCAVTSLSLSGGSGTDTYTTVSSTVTRKTVTGVP